MELLQLRYFYESAAAQSFAKTAQKYMVPASSVSAAVKRLEGELGCSLFDRSSNRIRLNEKGRQLQRSLRTVFAELDRVRVALAGEDDRELKLLVSSGRVRVVNHVIAFKKLHPRTRFTTTFDYQVKDYEDYDLIFDTRSDKYAGFEELPFYTRRLRFKAAADSPLCRRKLTLADLQDQPFVILNDKGFIYQALCAACRRAGFEPNVIAQVDDLNCYNKYVLSGLAIALGSEPAALPPDHSGSGQIRCLQVRDFDVTQTICAYYRPDAAYGSLQAFIEFLSNAE